MLDLKRLVGVLRGKTALQVIGVYIAGGWATLQGVELVVESVGLPDWVQPFALVLVLLGLPMVLATAIIQHALSEASQQRAVDGAEGPPDAEGLSGQETPDGSADVAEHPEYWVSARSRRLFTWRNAILGGVGALAVWGLVAAGWLALFERPAAPIEASFDPSAELASDAGAGEPADRPVDAIETDAGDGEVALTPPGSPTAAVPPPPAAPPPAAPPQTANPGSGRRAFDAARTRAAAARAAADEAGARDLSLGMLAVADSFWDAGQTHAADGRFTDASRDMELAAVTYDQSANTAPAAWQSRVDSARSELVPLRDGADPGNPAFAAAERLGQLSAQQQQSGDYAASLASLAGAATSYRAARRPAVEAEPAPAEPEEPAAGEPELREIVEEAIGRLERAFQNEDLDALRAVWVGLSSDQARNFESFFSTIRDVRVTVDVDWDSMVVGADRISVNGRTTWEFFNESDRRSGSQPPIDQRFELVRRDGAWVVLSVTG